ncbi:hypothetical protein ACFU6S_02655 [Streptomyces sp. NPDC057456]|uniref:hypothetical protein n=1 Tax=Streptomyces sp. NPDC057456 TaxID=3346139 RepID=UPI0036D147AD
MREEPAPAGASYDRSGHDFTMSSPDGVLFCSGGRSRSKEWQHTARRAAVFIAPAGDLS